MIMSQCGLLLFLGEKNPRMQQESRKRNSLKEVKRPISCVDPLNLWCVYCKLDIIIIIIKAKICVAYKPQQCNVVMRGRHNAAQIYLWHVTLWPYTRAQQKHADGRLLKTEKSKFFIENIKCNNTLSIHALNYKLTFLGLKKLPKRVLTRSFSKLSMQEKVLTRFYNIFYVLSCFCVANTGAQHKTTQRPWCSCLAFSSR